MSTNEIQELIDRYWVGKTSRDEERAICTFFSSHSDLPAELEQWRNWFAGKHAISQTGLSDEFDAKILSQIARTKQAGSIRLRRLWKPLAAAVMLGFLVYFMHDYLYEPRYSDQDLTEAELMENYQTIKELLYFTSAKYNETERVVGENLSKIDIMNQYIKIE